MTDPTNSRYRYIHFKGDVSYRRFVRENEKTLNKMPLITSEIEIPAHGSYGALLFDPRWRAKRQEILNRDNNSCLICAGADNLQVHHRQYHFVVRQNRFKLPWEYDDRLLISLCESCHKRGHNKYRVPTINI
jgi:hypothetical protein